MKNFLNILLISFLTIGPQKVFGSSLKDQVIGAQNTRTVTQKNFVLNPSGHVNLINVTAVGSGGTITRNTIPTSFDAAYVNLATGTTTGAGVKWTTDYAGEINGIVCEVTGSYSWVPVSGATATISLYDSTTLLGSQTLSVGGGSNWFPISIVYPCNSSSSISIQALIPTQGVSSSSLKVKKLAYGKWTGGGAIPLVPNVIKYTSGSGTYTPTSGTSYFVEKVVGAGGGGGGSGTAGGTAGTSGGNTTLGPTTAGGGGSGAWAGLAGGGSGGTPTLGTGVLGTALPGEMGVSGGYNTTTGYYANGGKGGTSPGFSGAGSGGGANTPGVAGTANTGGGGGAAGTGSTSASYSGSGGGSGAVVVGIVTNTSSAWASSFSYSIGAGGSGQAAGANGYPGAAGGSGYIEITEYVLAPSINQAALFDSTGMLVPSAGSACASGTLLADGSAVSRTTYSALFAKISTTYGVGDGSTTFNIPDARNVFLRGSNASTRTIGGISYPAVTLGATAGDIMQGHVHGQNIVAAGSGGALTGSAAATNNANTPVAANYNTTAPNTDGSNGTPRTGTETRPVNLGINYCIVTQGVLGMPVFTGSVISNTTGLERIERLSFGGSAGSKSSQAQCTASPCGLYSQSGTWVTGVTRTSTGNYNVAFNSSLWSDYQSMSCVCTATIGPATCVTEMLSSTTLAVYTFGSTTNVATDGAVRLICMGPR